MVEVQNLCVRYGKTPVLHNVSATFGSGRVTGLIGPNGCGKSTLLKTITGLCVPVSGRVLLEGEELSTLTRRETALRVACLPQSRNVPDLTALRMVLHGRFPHLTYPRRYRPEDCETARQALERVGAGELADRPLKELSGGQRQKVYLAMTLAQDTPIVLLDEPTTYLDISGQLEILRFSRALARMGKTVVLVNHDLDAVLHWSDDVLLLCGGRVAASGTPEELVRSGALERTFQVALLPADTPGGRRYLWDFRGN